ARWVPTERALELDAGEGFDTDVWRALAAAGLLGLGAPPDLGGSGGGVLESMTGTEELARGLPGLATQYVLPAMARRTLSADHAGPMSALIPEVADGSTIIAYGMSEPGGGTDLLRLRTQAREVAGEWELTGQKIWISMGIRADTILVLARTDPPEGGRLSRGLSVIAVPADQPGVV